MPVAQQNMFAIPNPPIEDRIAQFPMRPTAKELGANLGYGMLGSSSTFVEEDDQFLKVMPKNVPIKMFAIWMYFVLAVMSVFAAFSFFSLPADATDFSRRSAMGFCAACVFVGLFIIPIMMALLTWINKMEGTEAYLVFEKSSGIIELPRVSKSFRKQQLEEIIFLDRFVGGNRFWQVALLAQEDGQWVYVHLFNEAGSANGLEIFGYKNLYQKLADHLGVESRRLKFTKTESEMLPKKTIAIK